MSDAPPPEERTFTFRAIRHGDAEYDTLTLTEPTVGQMLKVSSERGMGSIVSLVSMIAGIPRDVVLLLPISVLRACNAYLELFTNPTGGPEGNE